jgi:hypothetical protein
MPLRPRAALVLTVLALAACGDDRQSTTAAPTAGKASTEKPTVAPAPAPAAKPAEGTTAAAPAPKPAATEAKPAAPAAPAPAAAAPTIAVSVTTTATAAPAAPVLPAGVDALIPRAAGAITVDGDGADWAGIRAVPAPFAKKAAGSLKLAWRDDGLYGYVEVADVAIDIEANAPWSGDCIELWLDPTGQRAPDMDDSCQLAIAPDPAAAAGECVLVVSQGQIDANAVKRAWKARPNGYAIEFFIPKDELKPAKLVSGSKLGFSYSIDDDGKPIEQFVHDKDTDEGYKTPSTWGLISLE